MLFVNIKQTNIEASSIVQERVVVFHEYKNFKYMTIQKCEKTFSLGSWKMVPINGVICV